MNEINLLKFSDIVTDAQAIHQKDLKEITCDEVRDLFEKTNSFLQEIYQQQRKNKKEQKTLSLEQKQWVLIEKTLKRGQKLFLGDDFPIENIERLAARVIKATGPEKPIPQETSCSLYDTLSLQYLNEEIGAETLCQFIPPSDARLKTVIQKALLRKKYDHAHTLFNLASAANVPWLDGATKRQLFAEHVYNSPQVARKTEELFRVFGISTLTDLFPEIDPLLEDVIPVFIAPNWCFLGQECFTFLQQLPKIHPIAQWKFANRILLVPKLLEYYKGARNELQTVKKLLADIINSFTIEELDQDTCINLCHYLEDNQFYEIQFQFIQDVQRHNPPWWNTKTKCAIMKGICDNKPITEAAETIRNQTLALFDNDPPYHLATVEKSDLFDVIKLLAVQNKIEDLFSLLTTQRLTDKERIKILFSLHSCNKTAFTAVADSYPKDFFETCDLSDPELVELLLLPRIPHFKTLLVRVLEEKPHWFTDTQKMNYYTFHCTRPVVLAKNSFSLESLSFRDPKACHSAMELLEFCIRNSKNEAILLQNLLQQNPSWLRIEQKVKIISFLASFAYHRALLDTYSNEWLNECIESPQVYSLFDNFIQYHPEKACALFLDLEQHKPTWWTNTQKLKFWITYKGKLQEASYQRILEALHLPHLFANCPLENSKLFDELKSLLEDNNPLAEIVLQRLNSMQYPPAWWNTENQCRLLQFLRDTQSPYKELIVNALIKLYPPKADKINLVLSRLFKSENNFEFAIRFMEHMQKQDPQLVNTMEPAYKIMFVSCTKIQQVQNKTLITRIIPFADLSFCNVENMTLLDICIKNKWDDLVLHLLAQGSPIVVNNTSSWEFLMKKNPPSEKLLKEYIDALPLEKETTRAFFEDVCTRQYQSYYDAAILVLLDRILTEKPSWWKNKEQKFLHQAMKNGHVLLVLQMCKECPIDAPVGEKGESLLQLALRYRNRKLIQALCEKGASLLATNLEGVPIYSEALQEDIDPYYLIPHFEDLVPIDTLQYKEIFFDAVTKAHWKTALSIIEHLSNIESPPEWWQNDTLHCELEKLFVQNVTTYNTNNVYGKDEKSVLMIVSELGWKKALDALLPRSSVNILLHENKCKNNNFDYILHYFGEEMLRTSLKRWIECCQESDDFFSLIRYLYKDGREECVHVVIAALESCPVEQQHEWFKKQLVKKSLFIDAYENNDMRLLEHIALSIDNFNFSRNSDNKSPLHIAAELHSMRLATLFLQRKARLEIRDSSGITAYEALTTAFPSEEEQEELFAASLSNRFDAFDSIFELRREDELIRIIEIEVIEAKRNSWWNKTVKNTVSMLALCYNMPRLFSRIAEDPDFDPSTSHFIKPYKHNCTALIVAAIEGNEQCAYECVRKGSNLCNTGKDGQNEIKYLIQVFGEKKTAEFLQLAVLEKQQGVQLVQWLLANHKELAQVFLDRLCNLAPDELPSWMKNEQNLQAIYHATREHNCLEHATKIAALFTENYSSLKTLRRLQSEEASLVTLVEEKIVDMARHETQPLIFSVEDYEHLKKICGEEVARRNLEYIPITEQSFHFLLEWLSSSGMQAKPLLDRFAATRDLPWWNATCAMNLYKVLRTQTHNELKALAPQAIDAIDLNQKATFTALAQTLATSLEDAEPLFLRLRTAVNSNQRPSWWNKAAATELFFALTNAPRPTKKAISWAQSLVDLVDPTSINPNNKNRTPLMIAILNNFKEGKIEKLLRKSSLFHIDADGESALQLLCKRKSVPIVHPKIQECLKLCGIPDNARTKYKTLLSYNLLNVPVRERPLVLLLCGEEAALQQCWNEFPTEVERLHVIHTIIQRTDKALYPYFINSAFAIDKGHLEYEVCSDTIPEKDPACEIDRDLFALYHRYDIIHDESVLTGLHACVDKILAKTPYLGTPPAGSAALEEYYRNIDNAICNTIQFFKKEISALEERKQKTFTELLAEEEVDAVVLSGKLKTFFQELSQAGGYCGGRIASVATQQYATVVQKKTNDIKTIVLQQLGTQRESLAAALVAVREDNATGQLVQDPQSTHAYNAFVHKHGKKYAIPGYRFLTTFYDVFAANHEAQVARADREFFSEYTPFTIAQFIKTSLKEEPLLGLFIKELMQKSGEQYVRWQEIYVQELMDKIQALVPGKVVSAPLSDPEKATIENYFAEAPYFITFEANELVSLETVATALRQNNSLYFICNHTGLQVSQYEFSFESIIMELVDLHVLNLKT